MRLRPLEALQSVTMTDKVLDLSINFCSKYHEGVEFVVLSTANSMIVQFRRKKITRHEHSAENVMVQSLPLPRSSRFRRFLCGYRYLLLGGGLRIVWRPGPVRTGGFERLSSAVGRLNAWGGRDVMVPSWPKPRWWKGASRRSRYSNWVERLCFGRTRSS